MYENLLYMQFLLAFFFFYLLVLVPGIKAGDVWFGSLLSFKLFQIYPAIITA